LLLCSGFFGSHSLWGVSKCATPFALADVGDSASGRAVRPCVAQSSLEPDDFPDNIYPDEIMTGTVATQSYLSPTTPAPSVFSTLWSGIDLPALWFWFVAVFLKLGGTSLAMLRLPPALFGTATVISLYALLRGTWDRYAAIAKARSWLSAFRMFITAPGAYQHRYTVLLGHLFPFLVARVVVASPI